MYVELLQAPPATVKYESLEQVTLTPGLDLILPCWNPSGAWVESLVRHYAEVTALMGPVPVQLILVNDGSTRNFTEEQMALLRDVIPGIAIVSYEQNRGKGYAVREGVKQSKYAFQVYTDLDFPFGVEAVKKTYDQLQQGIDVVAGERGAAYLKELPRKRRIITRISRMMNRTLLRLKVDDAQAGLKGFNAHGRSVLLNTRVDGFLYDSEFLYHAGKKPHLKIGVISVFCRPGIRFSSFRVKLLMKELRNYVRIITSANAA
ncbi:MAG TPA: glycosyltransferase [Chitinophaga sp.]|uniref:glycosyltransferase n=1 Tax=Chitinophaga sp. TaxID=1869181 RepID=UPI002BB71438|nr:glycosyltransferase [Chitinophaga sp.]HVI48160.1 glycosyltransferase [Chitinophaga sp.]